MLCIALDSLSEPHTIVFNACYVQQFSEFCYSDKQYAESSLIPQTDCKLLKLLECIATIGFGCYSGTWKQLTGVALHIRLGT